MEILPCLSWIGEIDTNEMFMHYPYACLSALSMDLSTFRKLVCNVDARQPILYHHLNAIMLNENIICIMSTSYSVAAVVLRRSISNFPAHNASTSVSFRAIA